VQPGWSKGTKITFPEMGNPQGKLMPADLVFIIDERPHDTFTREGDNLVTVQKISLTDALIGHTVTLKTCDGRILNIPCSDIIHPGYEKVIQNEGMPILKEPGKKGNLHIKFDLKFPKHLTPDQKTSIKKILG
jgi:DnaJ family protein B protein 4